MINIKKNDPRYRDWLIHQNEKKLRIRTKRNMKNKSSIIRPRLHKDDYSDIWDELPIEAPENFSLISNPNIVVAFFNIIIDFISKNNRNKSVFLNLLKVKNLTIDSIMYILAILKNLKVSNNIIRTQGNSPIDEKSRKLFDDSGFFKYVKSNQNRTQIFKKSECLEIQSGNIFNQMVTKDICDFVNKSFGTNRLFTLTLYDVVNELMLNTTQHAYDENSSMINYWYIFAENIGEKIKFTFLDTGSGIPSTIEKKFSEKVTELLISKHNMYIQSALNGEFRTRTKEQNRGKGLPRIFKYYEGKQIENLVIISGKGYCNLSEHSFDLEHMLNGTLFYWEIRKPV